MADAAAGNALARTDAGSPAASAGGVASGEWAVLDLLGLIGRHRGFLARFVGAITLGTLVVVALIPNEYESTASLLPAGESSPLRALGSIKSLLSLSSAMSGVDEASSILFPKILKSRAICDPVIAKSYTYMDGSEKRTQTLREYLKAKNSDLALKVFLSIYSINIDLEDGIVQLRVRTTSADLSQQVVAELIKQLDLFNRTKRKSRARANLEFIEQRITAVGGELAQAESSLTVFEVRNRNYSSSLSPELTRVYERLKRQREIKSSAYSLLTEQAEIARIDANKDLAIVSMLDPANLPVQKAGPARTLITLGAFLFALSLGLFLVVMRERHFADLSAGGRAPTWSEIRTRLLGAPNTPAPPDTGPGRA